MANAKKKTDTPTPGWKEKKNKPTPKTEHPARKGSHNIFKTLFYFAFMLP